MPAFVFLGGFVQIIGMKRWICLYVLVLAPTSAPAQKPGVIQKVSVRLEPSIPDSAGPRELFGDCPLEGLARGVRRQESNREKNRTTQPHAADIDSSATISAIMEPGFDADRWSEARGASIVGYVVEVKRGSRETVNCEATDPALMDTHIALVANANDQRAAARMIVEVTPRWRAFLAQRGEDWSTERLHETLLHHWVRITGWLFWDFEHTSASAHTARRRGAAWRATAWEIHPITAITICVPAAPYRP